ncbi:MAG: hypothetical protein MJ016_00700 [Victivallaceae bacterium]|nr:hypothetical protein [Victivallaceae bacterium]
MKTEGIAGRTLLESAGGIVAVEAGRRTLDDYLDFCTDPGSRRITSHLLLHYFRRKRVLDARVNTCIRRRPRPEVLALVRAALIRLFFQTAAPRETTVSVAVDLAKRYRADCFVNALLRRALREEWVFPDDPDAVLPPAILKRWRARFSQEEMRRFAACFLAEAPFCCRASGAVPEKISGAVRIPGFGGGVFFSAPAETVLASPEFAAGMLYVQDPAASFAPSLVDADGVGSAADLCAAPGGKALLLAEKLSPSARLFLFDASERRQRLTRQNFALRGRKAEISVARAQDVTGLFDLVVADVPCSNTGVFRRRPDALWRFRPGALGEIVALQKEILFHAATLVAPGGQLLYSTCSIEEEENTLLVREFEAEHRAFRRFGGGVILPDETRDGAGAFIWRREV